MEADAVILLAPITLAVTALSNEQTVLELLQLLETPHFSLGGVQVLAVTASTEGRVAF